MKLQPDKFDVQSIAASDPAWVAVATLDGGKRIEHSVLVGSRGELAAWGAPQVSELTEAHFDELAALKPELVVLGTGRTLKFVHPKLQRALMAARIGVETMDTLAACRTYNILAQEGRHVVAALVISPA